AVHCREWTLEANSGPRFGITQEVTMNITTVVRGFLIAGIALSFECLAEEPATTENAVPMDLQALALELQQEVTELRGLPFKRTVLAEVQPPEAFEEFLDDRITEVMPEAVDTDYG